MAVIWADAQTRRPAPVTGHGLGRSVGKRALACQHWRTRGNA